MDSIASDRAGYYTHEGNGVHVLRQPISCSFEPLQDITAFELAQLLPYFFNQSMFKEDYDALGSASRHLKINGKA